MYSLAPLEFILQVTEWTLKNTVFLFQDCTGACFASNSADLFLGLWEKDFVHHNIFSDRIKWWGCYIENILFWTSSEEELILFCAFQNTNNRNIKLCIEYS